MGQRNPVYHEHVVFVKFDGKPVPISRNQGLARQSIAVSVEAGNTYPTQGPIHRAKFG